MLAVVSLALVENQRPTLKYCGSAPQPTRAAASWMSASYSHAVLRLCYERVLSFPLTTGEFVSSDRSPQPRVRIDQSP